MLTQLSLVYFLLLFSPALNLNWQARPDDCGRKYAGIATQIVGGEPAEEYAWPWQVAMLENGEQICGASLIDPWWVITAAHCVDPCYLCEPHVFEFLAGSISLTSETNSTQVRRASRIFTHPEFDLLGDEEVDHDIALFMMSEPFNLTEDYRVNTICLPTRDMDDEFGAGKTATVTGWGLFKSGESDYPDTMYQVDVPIYDQEQCNKSLNGEITDNMICAGLPEGGVDACQGDSGGPLVSLGGVNNDQYYLIGIVSWGEGCGDPDSPGVYTRVTRFESWILPIFNNNYTLDSYVPCVCPQPLSSAVIGGLTSLSLLLAVSIGFNTALIIMWKKDTNKGVQDSLKGDIGHTLTNKE
nr:trypsin-like [Lytechinus pictus]